MEEQAFPMKQHVDSEGKFNECQKGLTKREYASIEAMKGILGSSHDFDFKCDDVSKWSIEQADSLIKMLKEGK